MKREGGDKIDLRWRVVETESLAILIVNISSNRSTEGANDDKRGGG